VDGSFQKAAEMCFFDGKVVFLLRHIGESWSLREVVGTGGMLTRFQHSSSLTETAKHAADILRASGNFDGFSVLIAFGPGVLLVLPAHKSAEHIYMVGYFRMVQRIASPSGTLIPIDFGGRRVTK
jgi:hypothetical protein